MNAESFVSPTRCHRLLLPHLVCLLANPLSAADWPQYRGPNHDGTSTETIRINWSEQAPRQVWKVALEPALSSLAISGGKAFTQVRRPVGREDQEFCIALNADTGEELWASAPLGIADYPYGGVGDDDGPRSTPSVDGDLVFVLTSYLRLACLDAATGQEVWSKDLKTEFGGTLIGWENAASPLIEGDLVIVNCNAPNQCLLAFHKQDGSLAWKGQRDGMTHATPLATTVAGVRQIIFYTQTGLVSVVPESGAVLWRYPVSYNGVSVAASPVVGGDMIFCSRAYPTRAGAVVVGITNSADRLSATEVWSTPNQLMNHWCTPVQFNGHLYGMFGHGLLFFKCVEMATGEEKWSVGGFGYGSVLVVNGKILALSESGELVLVDPNPSAYTELARFRALNGKCWNVPAVSNGRIYVRSTTGAVCLDVAPPPPQRLRLTAALADEGSVFQLLIGSEDGSPLDSDRAAKIEVFATLDLGAGVSGWSKLTNAAVLEDGQLRFDESITADTPQRFYRVEQR